MRHARHAALPVVPVVLVLLAACGGGGDGKSGKSGESRINTAGLHGIEKLTGTEILGKGLEKTSAVTTAHLKGRSSGSGEKFEMDLRMASNVVTGKVIVEGQQIDLVRLDSTLYLKAGSGFWRSKVRPGDTSLLDGKYLKTSTSDKKISSLIRFVYLPGMIYTVASRLGQSERGRLTMLNGKRVFTVNNGDGDTVYVLAEGEPYIVKVVYAKTGEAFEIDGFGEQVQAQAPPAGEVLDAAELSRGK